MNMQLQEIRFIWYRGLASQIGEVIKFFGNGVGDITYQKGDGSLMLEYRPTPNDTKYFQVDKNTHLVYSYQTGFQVVSKEIFDTFVSDKSAFVESSFQNRVQPWLMECFGETIAEDVVERNHRFLEESLELVQSCGCTKDEAHQLVEYVFNRPSGEKMQEVGGVMVTLAALCLAQNLDMHESAETELDRIWTKVEQIREKQATKPKYSPLPE